MLAIRTILSLVVGGAMVVGCKKETPAPAPAPAATPATPAAPSATPTPPVTPTSPVAPTPAASTQNPTSLPSLPEPAPLTTTTPGTGGSTSATDAKGLLADVSKNVEAKKWDAAESDLKKLTAMKSTLSPEMQKQVDDAEAKFVANKAASSLKLPGLGGGTPDTTPAEPNK